MKKPSDGARKPAAPRVPGAASATAGARARPVVRGMRE
ncbi:hypothetical protein MYA_3754 [Burkholderia sp. KJ006]|nr:hypothetical protein MYA_3754 [Burkholderia sp. KJ006]